MVSLGNLRGGMGVRSGNAHLDADAILETALQHARRKEYSDASFIGPLKRLLTALDTEADLSAFGRYSARFDVRRCLKNLLRFEAIEERDPAILARPIERPIFISGLPRSGTTFLHTLLAQDPAIAVPLSWQLVYPYPSRGIVGIDLRANWVDLQFRVMQFLSPELNELHPLAAREPQECTDITAQVFQSLRFDSIYRIPTYQNWLELHGHHDAYLFHKRFLQHLDAQSPGRRWVLKSPDHVFALDAIKAVYPDARIVFLHRDPLSVLASVAKLTEVLRRSFSHRIDRVEIGRQVCSSWVDGARRMMDAAERDGSILHLHYKHVVSAPMDAVAALYRHCGLSMSDAARKRMQAWIDRAPPNGNGRSRYSLTEFGLDEENLREQFSRYMDVFDVASEWASPAVAPRPA